MPPIIDRVGRTNDYTLLLIVILALAFGLSFIAQGLGLSAATGVFLQEYWLLNPKVHPLPKS
jgi:CPA2 family monovalent cation:H+ antiporter-2